MKKSNYNHRPALTAIAAVIACSTAPAAAQETVAPQTSAVQTPVTQSAPAPEQAPQQTQPVVTTAAPAPQSTAPQSTAPVVSTVPSATKQPTVPVVMAPPQEVVQPLPPKINVPAEAVETAAPAISKPAPARQVTAKAAPKKAAATPAPTSSAMAPKSAATNAPVANAAAVSNTDIVPATEGVANTAQASADDAAIAAIAAADAQIAAESAAAADAAVVEERATATQVPSENGNILPWALGLLGIGVAGGAIAMRRRTTIVEQNDDPVIERDYVAKAPAAETPFVESTREVVGVKASQSTVATPVINEVPIVAAPTMAERFHETAVFADGAGYHESIVDEGPTPDNPFKTRKARLKRARYLDRLAAQNGTAPAVATLPKTGKPTETETTRTVTFGTKQKVDA